MNDGWGRLTRPTTAEHAAREAELRRLREQAEREAVAALADHRQRVVEDRLAHPRLARVRRIWEQRRELEDRLGMPLVRVLGCGAWGCVLESEEPWVVKITLDPAEPPAWHALVDAAAGPGSPRVARIQSLDGGATAIVREDCAPAFELDDERRVQVATDWTLARLGGMRAEDVDTALEEGARLGTLDGWQALASSGEDPLGLSPEAPSIISTLLVLDRYVWGRQDPRQLLRKALSLQLGEVGTPIVETLLALLPRLLTDLHRGNVGWRVVSRIGDDVAPECLVITDPGGRL